MMNKAWLCGVALVMGAMPGLAYGQFGGGWGGGPNDRPLMLDIDAEVKPDFSPIIVLDVRSKQALQRNVQLLDTLEVHADYQEKPLEVVLQDLEKTSGIVLDIDKKALEDASIGTDSLVHLQRHASLRTILERVCQPLGLAWTPHREGLRVTTKEEAETLRVTVVYPVSDLIATPDGDDYDSLIELITSQVDPNSWKDSGSGEATIAPYPASGSLVLDAPWKMHEQLPPLLAALREAKTRQGIRGLRRGEAASVEEATTELSPPQARGRQRNRWSATGTTNGPTSVPASEGGFF